MIRKPSDDDVCVCLDTLQSPPKTEHVRAVRCESLLSTLPTRETFFFCMEIQKYINPTGPKLCEAAPQQFRILAPPTTTNHMGVPGSKVCEPALAEITLERHEICCRGGEIIPSTHFSAETCCQVLVRKTSCGTSYLGPNFVSST